VTATAGRPPGTELDGEPVVEVTELVREFSTGTTTIRAVDEITFRVEPGELVAVRGRSGSGKSTGRARAVSA
jgi:putative ABC transport system ATP-binding protein